MKDGSGHQATLKDREEDSLKTIIFSTLLLVACDGTYEVTDSSGSDEVCTFLQNDQLVNTELDGPCAWVVEPGGELSMKTIDDESVAIFLGRKVTADEAKQWSVEDYEHCSFQSVGVKIDEAGRPTSFSKPVKDLLVCSELPVDQKVFASFRWD